MKFSALIFSLSTTDLVIIYCIQDYTTLEFTVSALDSIVLEVKLHTPYLSLTHRQIKFSEDDIEYQVYIILVKQGFRDSRLGVKHESHTQAEMNFSGTLY